MKERREHQLARRSDYPRRATIKGRLHLIPLFPRTKSDDPDYRKSIWPAAKVERRRALGEQP